MLISQRQGPQRLLSFFADLSCAFASCLWNGAVVRLLFLLLVQIVRAHGGVCIADEVQTGFGRTGSAFWGFQNQGVQPDIVTMAKGIGNGLPLAAVVTTPEVAASLNSRIHFNT